MKTITNDRKRADHFNRMIDLYCVGNLAEANRQLNELSKIDLVRLVNKLRFYNYKIYVDTLSSVVVFRSKLTFLEIQ
jgi:hypothetical protein